MDASSEPSSAAKQLHTLAMRTTVFVLAGAVLLAGLAWTALLLPSRETSQDERAYPAVRTVQYSFNIQNTTNRLVQRVDFWTYAPVRETSLQQCQEISASHAYQLSQDQHGNQVLHFELTNLAPYETRVLRIRAQLGIATDAIPSRLTQHDAFLAPAPFIELGEPEIQRVANKLSHPVKADAAKKAFDWVVRNITHERYVEEDRGALHTVRSRRGDCTELAYLYSALCRLNGVPARVIGGYLHRKDGLLRPADYHNWVEIYVDGAWRIVDPHYGMFMEQESGYIAMTIITGSQVGPLADSHRFSYSGPNIQITMN